MNRSDGRVAARVTGPISVVGVPSNRRTVGLSIPTASSCQWRTWRSVQLSVAIGRSTTQTKARGDCIGAVSL
jgi:hypothetical protein